MKSSLIPLILTASMLATFVPALKAATIIQTGSVQLTTNHVLDAPVNLGASDTFQDTGSVLLPLFDPALGTLTQVDVHVEPLRQVSPEALLTGRSQS